MDIQAVLGRILNSSSSGSNSISSTIVHHFSECVFCEQLQVNVEVRAHTLNHFYCSLLSQLPTFLVVHLL